MAESPSIGLALAGMPKSGKSSVARQLSDSWSCPIIGFGDFVREEAENRGLAAKRPALQALGGELLNELGPLSFCLRALETAGASLSDLPLIWDGLRHPQVLEALKVLHQPHRVTLVYVAPPEKFRWRRFTAAVGSAREAERLSRHETESHLEELRASADLVVNADSVGDAVSRIEAFLMEGGAD